MRSRNIMSTIILQNISQLKALFKDDWEGIIGNADSFVYLGGNEQSTHKYISELLGKETIDTKNVKPEQGQERFFLAELPTDRARAYDPGRGAAARQQRCNRPDSR